MSNAQATTTTSTAANAVAQPPQQQQQQRPTKPPPTGPAPPAPGVTPPNPPQANAANGAAQKQVNGAHANHNHAQKAKKKADTPVDPQTMYESLKSKIAALEEELIHADEEEERFAEEAQKSVKGMEENAIHAKYIELFAEMKRVERDHAKEKQKLVKDKDTAKTQLTKANQAKVKLENLARDLTKDNKKLRDEKSQLITELSKTHDEVKQLNAEISKGKEKARQQEIRSREQPDILVKISCKYRAEVFFKVGRKKRLSALFDVWTNRMESQDSPPLRKTNSNGSSTQVNGAPSLKSDAASIQSTTSSCPPLSFIFTHQGRTLDPSFSIAEAGIEDGDELIAIEMMDLTGPVPDDAEEFVETTRPKIMKNWSDNPSEAKKAMEDIFDAVTRERLKLVLRQYELRERHFECFIRSKELELLLARFRESEQRQIFDAEKSRADKAEDEAIQLRKDLEEAHNGQTLLIEKLIQCCKEPNAERTQRLFTSLREELEKRGTKLADGPVGG
ncbi:hypothetical protein SCHPADRAFT_907914 [Schizopora paradoxa]|uniref:Ubiquitin-like domain-containing protein n=1 Tax=Schizopora paradoxa TaxID=27342 RepID=A0A0H2RIK6_9AGAM|nr:hypothetical protein SCHPADRAFT_907914 [Schizopora paradoxa]